jgi:capsular polysaccharide biosynthesis protein
VVISPNVAQNSLAILQQKLPTDIEKLKGTVAYLSHPSPRHYGRWVSETLPLLAIYEQYIGLDQIDYFYIGDLSRVPDFISEYFEYLGISPHKIIANPCKGSRTLRAFSSQASSHYYNRVAYTYSRQVVTAQLDLNDNCCYHPRVYIARGKVAHRKVKNQEAVYEVLRPYDFELRVLDNLKVREQAQIFYHADVLIAPHGSAITNLIYGKQGNKVLEILPNDCPNAQYFSLAAYAQMQYFAMYSQPSSNPILDACNQDIEVNLELLETFCRQHC